ncbi:MAG: PD-(D/E)XK nuclease family protein [bacterium]|nr:PD-(D/E)XK nuclease family protein [bacterium]
MNYADLLDDSSTGTRPHRQSGGSPGRDTSGYRVRGERVPSVTEVIDLGGLSDIEQLKRVAGADVVENASLRGRIVHGYCDVIDLDEQFDVEDVPEPYRGYVAAYVAFKAETGFEPIEIELAVTSSTYLFAGTIDRIGMYPDGRVTLLDLKTPAQPSPTWRVQTAGYAIAANDVGIEPDERAALRLQPNGKPRLLLHDDPEDRRNFFAALRVAHYRLAQGLAHLED